MQTEDDKEYARGLLTRKMESGEDVIIQTDRAAVLRNVSIPKAQYHYVVLPKEDIVNVTALTRDHLPLLDHMMELAIRTIELQKHLPSDKFLIGFKMDSFMNRLNMHVISNDFCSNTMRHLQHWNTFNTDLFITFQAVFALLNSKGFIEALEPERAAELLNSIPVHCNQCNFITGNFHKFKDHLHWHWQRRENEAAYKMTISKSRQTIGTKQMNVNRAYRIIQAIPENTQKPLPQGAQQEAPVVPKNMANLKPNNKCRSKKNQSNNNNNNTEMNKNLNDAT